MREEYTQAEEYVAEGLRLASAIDHRERLCALFYIGGLAAVEQHHWDDARSYLEQGLDIARGMNDPRRIGQMLSVKGEYALRQQQLDDALLAFGEALHYGESCGSRDVMAIARFGLARRALLQGESVPARQEGQRSLTIFKTIKHRRAAEVEQWLATLPLDDHSETLPS